MGLVWSLSPRTHGRLVNRSRISSLNSILKISRFEAFCSLQIVGKCIELLRNFLEQSQGGRCRTRLGSNGGDTPQPSPIYGGRLLKENLAILDTLLTNRPNPQAPETRGEGEVGGAEEPDGAPLFEKAVHRQTSPAEAGLGQSENANTNFPQTISTFLQLSQGRMAELTSLLSELSGTTLTTEMTCKWLGLDF